jgi:hypothetical protein
MIKRRFISLEKYETYTFKTIMFMLMARDISFKAEYSRDEHNLISFGCSDEFWNVLVNNIKVVCHGRILENIEEEL